LVTCIRDIVINGVRACDSFVFKLTYGASPAAWLIDWLKFDISEKIVSLSQMCSKLEKYHTRKGVMGMTLCFLRIGFNSPVNYGTLDVLYGSSTSMSTWSHHGRIVAPARPPERDGVSINQMSDVVELLLFPRKWIAGSNVTTLSRDVAQAAPAAHDNDQLRVGCWRNRLRNTAWFRK